MEHSTTIGEIAKALKNFQFDIAPIDRDAKANYGRYASLGNILKHIKTPLAENDLSFVQMVEGDTLTTMIMHVSGEWIRATGNMKLDKQTAQGQGSAITYARRYQLSAALGLDTDEDDDGAEGEKAAVGAKTGSGATKPAAASQSAAKAKAVATGLTERQLAAIDRIKIGLGHLGEPNDTKAEVIESVKKVTGKEFQLAALDAIGDAVWALVEAQIDPTK